MATVTGTVEFGVGGRVTGVIGEASNLLFSSITQVDRALQTPDRVLVVIVGEHDHYGHRIPVRQVTVVRDLKLNS